MSEAESIAGRHYHHGDLRRALIEAALTLVTEEQDWAFSLREVARRAGVSHNAPYNHFPEKRDLLGAVAAAGFEALRARMLAATVRLDNPSAAFFACAKAYVEAGVENPALYRLMFGSTLVANDGLNAMGDRHRARPSGGRPAEARDAGRAAKAVLDDIVLRGAETGAFAVSPTGKNELALASLTVWSCVHGLTMLLIDDLTGSDLAVETLVRRTLRKLLDGLGSD
jgi:AcrR family transcriptional regulator